MIKIEDVEVICSDSAYKLVVAVYRSTTSPKRLIVHIERIVVAPPIQLQEPLGEPDVAKVVGIGNSRVFKALLYHSRSSQ